MTKNEKLIVSAYTGVLMVDWNEFLDFAEESLRDQYLRKKLTQKNLQMNLLL